MYEYGRLVDRLIHWLVDHLGFHTIVEYRVEYVEVVESKWAEPATYAGPALSLLDYERDVFYTYLVPACDCTSST